MSKILIVEDEGILALDIKHKLVKEGYDITSIVHYGEDVIPSIKKTKPDLVLMDINLAGETDGITAAEKVKNDFNIPVIYLTAYADEKTLSRAKITEPYGYIIKPFEIRELVTNISISLYRKQMQDEMDEIRANKDRLFSIVAHDLRSSFSGFMNLSGLLLNEFEKLTINEMHEMSEALYKSSSQLYKLLENLLEWSRLQRGTMTVNKSRFKLKRSVAGCINMMQPLADEKDIDIVTDIPENIDIIADKGMIDIVIRNLLSNALKFSPEKSEIVISAEAENGYATVHVKDNGIGIPKEMIDNIFQLEFNSNRKGTNNEKGTGIGLNLCRDLIKKNSGKIWVKSEEGKGTVFSFTLPRAAEE